MCPARWKSLESPADAAADYAGSEPEPSAHPCAMKKAYTAPAWVASRPHRGRVLSLPKEPGPVLSSGQSRPAAPVASGRVFQHDVPAS
jgi:hypothetical protein